MAVRPEQWGAELAEGGLDALAEAGLALGLAGSLSEAMQIVAEAVGRAAGAEVVVVRVADDARRSLNACAVATSSAAVGAELEGSRVPLEDVPEDEVGDLTRLPESVQRAAERVGASSVLLVPVRVDGRVEGSVELMRRGHAFDDAERRLARLAVGQAALAIRAFAGRAEDGEIGSEAALTLTGEALAAGADELRTAEEITRFATEASGALAGPRWRPSACAPHMPCARVSRHGRLRSSSTARGPSWPSWARRSASSRSRTRSTRPSRGSESCSTPTGSPSICAKTTGSTPLRASA